MRIYRLFTVPRYARPMPSPPRPVTIMRRLGRDRSGAAIIEFAICGAAFIALTLATLITALAMFAQQYVQSIAEEMARDVMTGKAQMAGTTAAQFKQQACGKLPPFLTCGKLMIDLRRASSFATANTSAPVVVYDSTGKPIIPQAYDAIAPGEIIVLKVMYLWPVSPGPLGFSIANAGKDTRLLIGTQVLKSEAYS